VEGLSLTIKGLVRKVKNREKGEVRKEYERRV